VTQKRGAKFGNYSKKSEGREEAKVLVAQAQPLQNLRTSAGLFTQVWPVPPVLSAVGAAGRDPWSFEVVLVEETLLAIRRSLFARSSEGRTANSERRKK
jgi:hypothetical protein